jgi:mitochondrial intermediate peptidase
LYNAILKAEREGTQLTDEALRAATTLRVDFEKGGIHLPKGCPIEIYVVLSSLIFKCQFETQFFFLADKLEHINQLNLEIAQLGRK